MSSNHHDVCSVDWRAILLMRISYYFPTYRNLEHMAAVHCFFIPDHDSVIDLEGLIDYLGQKISIGCVCVGCNHGFKSPAATRDHMLSKGHTRMAYSTV